MSARQSIDRYAVIGNPIAHSKSPLLHARFAALTGQAVQYGRLLAPLDGFAQTVAAMRAAGMRGANVTVPFKFEAFALCTRLSDRARLAGAVNTLSFREDGIHGDNTDGAGLVNDLQRLLAQSGSGLRGARILLLGAGGAVAGVLRPLLDAQIQSLTVLNRTPGKAHRLVDSLRQELDKDPGTHPKNSAPHLLAGGFDTSPEPVEVIINGTSSGLQDAAPAIDTGWFTGTRLAYDMLYGPEPTAFMRQAVSHGVDAADGLGMLVGQAAESFFVWRGVRPPVEPVLEDIRASMAQTVSSGGSR